jgi:DNA polymerase-1
MIKLAMISIQKKLNASNLKSKMVLQVHDELVFDVLKEEADDMKALILTCMQSAIILPNNVPIVAEVGIGENWLVAH